MGKAREDIPVLVYARTRDAYLCHTLKPRQSCLARKTIFFQCAPRSVRKGQTRHVLRGRKKFKSKITNLVL